MVMIEVVSEPIIGHYICRDQNIHYVFQHSTLSIEIKFTVYAVSFCFIFFINMISIFSSLFRSAAMTESTSAEEIECVPNLLYLLSFSFQIQILREFVDELNARISMNLSLLKSQQVTILSPCQNSPKFYLGHNPQVSSTWPRTPKIKRTRMIFFIKYCDLNKNNITKFNIKLFQINTMKGKEIKKYQKIEELFNMPRKYVKKTQKSLPNNQHQLKEQQRSFETTAHTTLTQYTSTSIEEQVQEERKQQKNRQIIAYPSVWEENQLRQIQQVQQDSNQADQEISSFQEIDTLQDPEIPPFLSQYMSDIVKEDEKPKKKQTKRKTKKSKKPTVTTQNQPIVTLTFPNKKKYMIGVRDLYRQWHYLLDQIHR